MTSHIAYPLIMVFCFMIWTLVGYSISLSGLVYRIETEPFAACVACGCFIALALLGASAVKAAALS